MCACVSSADMAARQWGSPLHDWSLVFDPVARALLVGFHRAKSEAAPVLLQHLSLVVIGSVRLSSVSQNAARREEGWFYIRISSRNLHFGVITGRKKNKRRERHFIQEDRLPRECIFSIKPKSVAKSVAWSQRNICSNTPQVCGANTIILPRVRAEPISNCKYQI